MNARVPALTLRRPLRTVALSPRAARRDREDMRFTVLIAPSGFKESLGASEVAEHIAQGVLRALPQARVIRAPMADGGEGFTEALVAATGGRMHPVRVTGPVGDPVESFFGILGGRKRKTAVIEMAAAAGLRLVPRDRRNPMLTTSHGVGELIRAALDAGAHRILLGCGDSGINDGGAGMAQALGAKLLDEQGREIGPGGGALLHLARIDLSELDPRLALVQLDAAVNWHNVLLGDKGVARVFGPQKGATPEQVELLDAALQNYARCIQQATGLDLGRAPGSGASGGLGAGFAGLLGGTLHPRYSVVMQYLELGSLIDQADLVITAEGSLDEQTPRGKIPAEVATRAKQQGLPVIALAGTIGRGVRANLQHGIDAYASILHRPCTLDEAFAHAGDWLAQAAEDNVRMVTVGWRLAQASHAWPVDLEPAEDPELLPTASAAAHTAKRGAARQGLSHAAWMLALPLVLGASLAEAQPTVVRVDGSSTVFPLAEAAAEEFQRANRGQRATVGISGTGGGFKKFCRGETDVQNASRPILATEMDQCRKAGISFVELPIAFDAVTVVVHPKNPIQDISIDELKKMWEPAAQGQVQRWNQVSARMPDAPLALFGAGADSGTFDYFTEAVTGKGKSSRGDYTASEDDNVLVQGVSRNVNGLGFFGMAYYQEHKDKLRALPVRWKGQAVAATEANVLNGSYQPLSRPVFVYVNSRSLERPEVRRFVDFTLRETPKLAREVKMLPLPPVAYADNLRAVETRRTGTRMGGKNQVGLTIEQLLALEARD